MDKAAHHAVLPPRRPIEAQRQGFLESIFKAPISRRHQNLVDFGLLEHCHGLGRNAAMLFGVARHFHESRFHFVDPPKQGAEGRLGAAVGDVNIHKSDLSFSH